MLEVTRLLVRKSGIESSNVLISGESISNSVPSHVSWSLICNMPIAHANTRACAQAHTCTHMNPSFLHRPVFSLSPITPCFSWRCSPAWQLACLPSSPVSPSRRLQFKASLLSSTLLIPGFHSLLQTTPGLGVFIRHTLTLNPMVQGYFISSSQ